MSAAGGRAANAGGDPISKGVEFAREFLPSAEKLMNPKPISKWVVFGGLLIGLVVRLDKVVHKK
jgi:hypothetical protein